MLVWICSSLRNQQWFETAKSGFKRANKEKQTDIYEKRSVFSAPRSEAKRISGVRSL